MAVGALTTGAPTAAGTYNVQTSTDRALSSAPATQQIGSIIGSVNTLGLASADRLPNRVTTVVMTAAFTVITPIPIGGKITLTFAKNYLSAVSATSTVTFGGKTTASCVLNAATGTGTKDTVVCTTAVDVLAAAAQTLTFPIGAITTGLLPQSASTYTVSSSTDRESTSANTVALGGTLHTKVDIAFATTGNRVPGTLNTDSVTLGFTTVNAVPIGGKITIALPSKYFSAVDSSKANTLTGTGLTATCVLTPGVTGTSVLGIASADTVICTTAGAQVAATTAITFTFVAGAVTTGSPQGPAAFNVATSMDQQMATPGATKDLGGITYTKVNVAFATAGDKVPGTLNTGTVTFGFRLTNPLPAGGKITIALPPKYFSAVDSTKANTLTGGATASCVLSAGVTGTSVLGIASADTVICTTAAAQVAAASAITFTFIAGAVTTGTAQAAGNIQVATSLDRADVITRSPPLTYSQAVDKTTAGAITGTITFNFRLYNSLSISSPAGKITIAVPRTYFTAVDTGTGKEVTFKVGTSSYIAADTTKATCAVTGSFGSGTTTVYDVVNADVIVCTLAGTAALAAGEIEVKFAVGSLTTGAGAATLTTFNVGNSADDDAALQKNTLQLGDTLAITTTITLNSADQVPNQVNTVAITVVFTVKTAIPSGGKITLTLPKAYFAKVDESKANTLTTPSGTTATCALVQATGVETKDSIICTTSGAVTGITESATSGTSQTLTFAAGTITTGGAVASGTGTFNVASSVDLKATSDTNTPQLGAQITDGAAMAFTNPDDKVPGKFASNNATITLGFTGATAIPIGGKITITLPQRYFTKVDGTKDNTVGTSATAKCELANVAQTTVPAIIALGASTVATSTTLTVSFVPSIVSGVTQVAIPLVGFSLDSTVSVACASSSNCVSTTAGKVTAALANGVLTLTLASDNFFVTKNILTSIVLTGVTTPATAGWATTGIIATVFNPSTTVVCTTAGAIVATGATVFTFVAGSVTIGVGQKASTYQVETSVDLPLAPGSAKATVALGGGVSVGKPLAFANAQDQIPGRVNTGAISLGATLANSVPIGGQFLLTFPSNYFAAVNPASVVTLTKGTRRSLLQTSTLSCVRVAGNPNDQITCTLAGAASGTGAVVLTFPAGSLTTGLPTSTSGGFNLATANPPAASAARVPYFPKAAGSAYGVAWLLVALSALLACF